MKSAVLKRLALIIFSISAIALTPAYADEWSKNYNVNGKPDLRIETSDANIHVTTWDQNTIAAKVTTTRYKIGDGGLHIDERQNANAVEINVRFPHHSFNIGWNSHRVDITIQMPREGNVNLNTGDGEIAVADLKGAMDLRTGDGAENLDNVDGNLHATTGDGHIQVTGRFDELQLRSGDGHVDARAAAGSNVASNWRLESGDGSISLEVPSSLAADVDLHTGDGHIDLDVPITAQGQIRGNDVRGKLNGGGNLLTIHTGDGSIHLKKGGSI